MENKKLYISDNFHITLLQNFYGIVAFLKKETREVKENNTNDLE